MKHLALLPAELKLSSLSFRSSCVVKRLWSTQSSLMLTPASGKDGGLQ